MARHFSKDRPSPRKERAAKQTSFASPLPRCTPAQLLWCVLVYGVIGALIIMFYLVVTEKRYTSAPIGPAHTVGDGAGMVDGQMADGADDSQEEPVAAKHSDHLRKYFRRRLTPGPDGQHGDGWDVPGKKWANRKKYEKEHRKLKVAKRRWQDINFAKIRLFNKLAKVDVAKLSHKRRPGSGGHKTLRPESCVGYVC